MTLAEELRLVYVLLVDVRMGWSEEDQPALRLRLAQFYARKLGLTGVLRCLDRYFMTSSQEDWGDPPRYDPDTYAGEAGWTDARYLKSAKGGYEELEARYPELEEKTPLSQYSPDFQALVYQYLSFPEITFDL